MSIINTQATQNPLQTDSLLKTNRLEQLTSAGRVNRIDDDSAGLAIGTSVLADAKNRVSPLTQGINEVGALQSEQKILSATKEDLNSVRDLQQQREDVPEDSVEREQINEQINERVNELEQRLSSAESANVTEQSVSEQFGELELRSSADDVDEAISIVEQRQQDVDQSIEESEQAFSLQAEGSDEQGIFSLVNQANQNNDRRVTTSDLAQEVAGDVARDIQAQPEVSINSSQNIDPESVLKVLEV